MINRLKRLLPYVKVAFFFPLCWVIGGTFVLAALFMLGVSSPWPYFAYFAVGLFGTIWFVKS